MKVAQTACVEKARVDFAKAGGNVDDYAQAQKDGAKAKGADKMQVKLFGVAYSRGTLQYCSSITKKCELHVLQYEHIVYLAEHTCIG